MQKLMKLTPYGVFLCQLKEMMMDKTMNTTFEFSIFNLSKMRADANKVARDMGFTDEGDIDAFRHTYTSAKMQEAYGSTLANAAGQANEIGRDIFGNNPANDRGMDIHNNEVGRGIESKVAGQGLTGVEKERKLREEVAAAIRDGRLQTDPNILPKPNQSSQILSQPSEIRNGPAGDINPTTVPQASLLDYYGKSGGGEVHVSAYDRSTGSVHEHYRSHPDGNVGNNLAAAHRFGAGHTAGFREPTEEEKKRMPKGGRVIY